MKKELKEIIITDLSDYDSDLCRNGGRYAFYKHYLPQPSGMFRLEYGTSADFEFCPRCGTWGKHRNCTYSFFTKDEVLNFCEEAEKESDVSVEFVYLTEAEMLREKILDQLEYLKPVSKDCLWLEVTLFSAEDGCLGALSLPQSHLHNAIALAVDGEKIKYAVKTGKDGFKTICRGYLLDNYKLSRVPVQSMNSLYREGDLQIHGDPVE